MSTNDRPFLFRTPTRCQNGHFRFLLYSIDFGHCEPSLWEREPCSCPTGEIGEGFSKCGPEQQFTGLLDRDDKKIFEGDILAYPYDITLRNEHVWPHQEWVVAASDRVMEVSFRNGSFVIYDRGTGKWFLLGVANLKEMGIVSHIYDDRRQKTGSGHEYILGERHKCTAVDCPARAVGL